MREGQAEEKRERGRQTRREGGRHTRGEGLYHYSQGMCYLAELPLVAKLPGNCLCGFRSTHTFHFHIGNRLQWFASSIIIMTPFLLPFSLFGKLPDGFCALRHPL
jgi:hypothetical protein